MRTKEKEIIAAAMLLLQKKKSKMTTAEQTAKSEKWFADKVGVKVVERGLKVSLPTKKGLKQYEAVRFNNKRIGVILTSGIIKYARA